VTATTVDGPAIDDDLWAAIGDPTRRRVLDLLLAGGGATATSLSEQLPVTRQAVSKHLAVLDRAGLVRATAAGREKRYRIDDAQLARAVAQLAAVETAWDARLRRIKTIAETIERQQQTQRREGDSSSG
jgi:DNA-binding transcriptional ArsR family regulator